MCAPYILRIITAVSPFNNAMKADTLMHVNVDDGSPSGGIMFSLSFFLPSSQDEKLKKLVEQHGTDSWKLIANFFPVSM